MKTKGTNLKVVIIAFLLAIIGKTGSAQTFNAYIANDHLVSPTVYEFDTYLEPTSTDFYLRSIQFGIQFNSAFIPVGATITPSYDNSVSQLVTPYSAGNPQWVAGSFVMNAPSSSAGTCSGSPSTANGQTLFSTATGAKRIVRFRLTSSLPFNCAPPNPSMVLPVGTAPSGSLRMAVSAWGPTCLAVALNNNGTYTNFANNTQYGQVNNLHEISVTDPSPSTVQLCAGAGGATFTVTGTGNGTSTPLQYQWMLNGSPLSDNGVYSGTTTNTLTVTNPTVGGTLTVQVQQCSPTNPIITSNSATLNVVQSDDNNACTIDACDPATGNVSHTPVNTNDNNVCTTDGCDPATGVFHTPVNTDDNNPCTSDGCDPVTGVFHNQIDFSDANVCDVESCDPATGNISHTPVNVNDNNACTTDGCDPSTGPFHNPVNTDDNNACTTDGCDPATGPFHNQINTNDNNACTTDGCDPVSGAFHTPVDPNDNNACTADACDPATGVHNTPINTNDNNACTTDGCDPATGPFHTPVNTDDNNACTTDACDPVSGPSHTPINTNDNNACTTDGCDPVSGPFHNPVNTNDNNPCTADGCDPVSGVFHNPIDFSDANVCDVESCDPATGNISHTPVNTNDNNACTTDGCDPSTGVFHNPVNTNDNNVCTTDGCDPSTGVFHNPVNTNDNNVCTTDGCDPVSGPFHTPVNTNDNNVCTTDGCDPATGVFHNPVNTNDNNVCTTDGCDPVTGPFHTPVNTDDNNACTTDGCDPVTGVFHNPVNTDDNNACTTDGCNPSTGVFHNPVNTDDNNACTTDGCDPVTGVFHNPIVVSDANLCDVESCDPATGNVTHTPVNTDDNNACTLDGCDPATGVFHTAIPVVPDGNACTTDGCDPQLGMIYTPVSTDDNNACTVDGCDPTTGVYHSPDPAIDDNDVCTTDNCDPQTGNITHTPILTASATSTDAGCTSLGTASAFPIGNYSYLWSNGGTDQTITGLQPGNYSVTVTDLATGCTGTASTTVGNNGGGTSSNPGPIMGPLYVCKGQNNIVYCVDPVPGATSYQWTLPNGVIGTSTGPCITVRISSRFHSGQICVVAVAPCGNSNPTCITITRVNAKPNTPGPITGPIELCPGQTDTYSINPVPFATGYEWVVNNGLIINSGQGTTSISVTAPAGFTGGTIKVRAVNCRGKSGYRVLNITGLPPALEWDNKERHDNMTVGVCGGSTYHYDTHYDGISCRIWTAPQGAVIYNSATHQSGNPLQVLSASDGVYITFPPGFVSGQVTVSACNSCGVSAPITLNVRSTPMAPVAINGHVNGVCRQSNVEYSISSVPGATSYSWTFPPGVQVQNTSNGGKTKKVRFLNNFSGSGQICVTANNNCGSSDPVCVTVESAPHEASSINGPSSVCRSQSNLAYSISGVWGSTSYLWSVTNGVQIISGQGTRNIRLRFVNANSSSAVLSVVAVNSCGQSPSIDKTININLNCRVADGESETTNMVGSELNAFPNPTSGKATVTFNSTVNATYVLQVTDLLGKVIFEDAIPAVEGYNMKEIDLQGVTRGLYLVTLRTEGKQAETLRLIVE